MCIESPKPPHRFRVPTRQRVPCGLAQSTCDRMTTCQRSNEQNDGREKHAPDSLYSLFRSRSNRCRRAWMIGLTGPGASPSGREGPGDTGSLEFVAPRAVNGRKRATRIACSTRRLTPSVAEPLPTPMTKARSSFVNRAPVTGLARCGASPGIMRAHTGPAWSGGRYGVVGKPRPPRTRFHIVRLSMRS